MWGSNSNGQLGNGATNEVRLSPIKVGVAKWKMIACGYAHTLGIQEDGSLWGWGSNSNGQLGTGNDINSSIPIRIGTAKWKMISCGSNYSLGIQEDGSLWGWGVNGTGQLGIGSTERQLSPKRIDNQKWKQISVGDSHSLGVREDGLLFSWGDGSKGKLGLGNYTASLLPRQVGTAKWKKIAAGHSHSLGIQEDGSLWGWGQGGAVGDGTTTDRTSPVRIRTNDNDWSDVSAGETLSLAIKENKTLFTWGTSSYGALGRETSVASAPGQVLSDVGWTNVTYSKYFAIGIKEDGTAWSWGDYNSQSLGYSASSSVDRPRQITTLGTDNSKPFSSSDPVSFNAIPNLTLNTSNNRTLYENDTFSIDGLASDTDIGNILIVKYQINSESARAISTAISDGTTEVPFNEQLVFKNGRFYKGNTEMSSSFSEGVAYQLKVWAEDDKGGKSVEHIRTFYAVPNRAPSLTVDSIENKTDLINADKMTISGNTVDLDGNDVTVRYKVNNGQTIQIHSGAAGAWSFDLSIKDLNTGDNVIVVEVIDNYNFKTSKTIRLKKHSTLEPISETIQRYKIVAPKGSAKGVLLWVQREESQIVNAEISMTDEGAPEAYVPMELTVTAPVSVGIIEDEFIYETNTAKAEIYLKLKLTGTGAVTLISGVLE